MSVLLSSSLSLAPLQLASNNTAHNKISYDYDYKECGLSCANKVVCINIHSFEFIIIIIVRSFKLYDCMISMWPPHTSFHFLVPFVSIDGREHADCTCAR